jgi:excisionase family DNA binding protein
MSKSNPKLAANFQTVYSVADVCRIVTCGKTTVYAAINARALKARKIGRRTIILDEDLRAWLNSLPLKGVAV